MLYSTKHSMDLNQRRRKKELFIYINPLIEQVHFKVSNFPAQDELFTKDHIKFFLRLAV